MSAKCNNSSKYYPLLREMYDRDTSINKDVFMKFVNDNFIDPDIAVNMILSRIDPSPTQITPAEIEQINSRTGFRVNTESDNAQSFYTGNDQQYQKMKQQFINNIISKTIFDINTEQFINANQLVRDITLLNKGIINYKKQLLNTIASYVNDIIDEDNLESEYVRITNLFKSIIDNNSKKDDTYYQAFNAYVTLKTFDNLVSILTPFIKINKEYKNFFSLNRYSYVGPNVTHYAGWGNKNEFMSLEENTSDLVKILLDYFPTVNSKGEIIENTSIGLQGFNSVMSKLKSWAENNTDLEISEEWNKGVNRDMNMILNKYIKSLNRRRIKNPEHITYLTEKLNGIIRFIYNKNMPTNIKNMFTHLVDKTVTSSYISYSLNDKKDLEIKNLVDRPVMMQQMVLNDILEASPIYWKSNKDRFNNLVKKHNIKISQNTITIGDNEISIFSEDGKVTSESISNINELIKDFTQLLIPDNFNEVSRQVFGSDRYSADSLYLPILAYVLLDSKGYKYKTNIGQLKDLARVLNVINGSDTVNVIKNSEGNNLPIFQMVCLSYLHKGIHDRISEQISSSKRSSQYLNNIIYNNIQYVYKPKIRSEVAIQNNVRQAVDLNDQDVIYLAIGYDYFQSLFTKQSNIEGTSETGIIGIQTHVYSDKNKHFVMQFDVSKSWKVGDKSVVFKDIISEYFKTGKQESINPILDIWFESNSNQMKTIAKTLIDDYNTALGKDFKTLNELNLYLNSVKDIKPIKALFKNVGIDFQEEFHISKNPINKKFQVNETLMNFFEIFSNRDNFNKFIKYQFNQFLTNSKGAIKRLSSDKNITKSPQFKDSKWISENTLVTEINGEYNPLLFSYFIMDSFLSNEYNKMVIGDIWYHPNKDKTDVKKEMLKNVKDPKNLTDEKLKSLDIKSKELYNKFAMASRWIAQVKRMVIFGATYHSYAQGLKNGVPAEVKMAVIQDVPAMTYNFTGESNENDSMDGSGFTSPYFSRQQNISLIDAAVGSNKKTIYHDIDQYGRPTLLKWAEYEITNGLRRKHGNINVDKVFKKMHSLSFNTLLNYHQNFDNLYYQDTNTGEYYQIKEININDGIGSRIILNTNTSEIISQNFGLVDTIYKIDQLFGGAWAAEYDSNNNLYKYTEENQNYINEIICNNNLKDYMIGWLVNKSAIKVGAANLNTYSKWNNDEELDFIFMSTKFGGVQMDADHELNEAETTESSQMISALEQNGFTHEIANDVYMQLGKFVYDSIQDLQNSVNSNDQETLYKVFGKAIVKAFQSGTKDTLGLAQAFISLAQEGLKNNNITYKIPFSSPSINGIFNSTVTTSIIKSAIRRHYNGVAAVLNPSYGMVNYYEIDAHPYSYESLINYVLPTFKGTALEGRTIDDLINDNNYQTNPYIIEVTDNNPVDFEDTIIVYNEDGTINSLHKITTFEQYDYFRNYETRIIRKHTLKPKNLKGSDTIFTIGDVKYSIYNTPYNRALFFLNNISGNDLESIKSELFDSAVNSLKDFVSKEVINDVVEERYKLITDELLALGITDSNLNKDHFEILKKSLQKKQQSILDALANNAEFSWGYDWEGNPIVLKATTVKVIPAQIIMGKLYAKELGLLPGDSVSNIKQKGSKFFEDRIKGYYTNNNTDINSYDLVLYNGTGRKLFVKYRSKNMDNYYPNDNYKEIEGSIYYNGKELFSSNGKQFVTYVDGNNNEYDVVIVDDSDRVKEVLNSKIFNNIEYNYQPNNFKTLVQLEFGEDLVQIPVLKSKTKPNSNPFYYKNIAEFTSNTEIIQALKIYHDRTFNDRISKIAEDRFKAFEKSLRFIATRIPCQSMQSFMPVEIIEFSDSEVNEVYIPVMQTWIQGSDYDIDKSYIMGYSVSNNGQLLVNDEKNEIAPYLIEDAQRNRIVDGIFNVILNPKNQINLTTPISTDRIKSISSGSEMGKAAKYMNGYDPSSKYRMQIENATGKTVIGNVATGIKSFFAVSNVFNTRFNEIYNLIIKGDFYKAQELLNRYTFKNAENKIITLANVNMDKFKSLDLNTIPEELANNIKQLIDFQDSLPDESMILGELLNSATDGQYKQKMIK